MLKGERISREAELSSWRALHLSVLYQSNLVIKFGPATDREAFQ